jgi:fido (protein-threonine AMPylation protein)
VTDPDDPLRTYSPEEESALTANLVQLTQAIHGGDTRQRPIDIAFLQDVHAGLFRGVRDHAGRMRARGFGQEWVIFGPHRSVHRDVVAKELQQTFNAAQRQLVALEETSETYELDLLQVAVKLHADIIRVHPFEDGNGRSSRLCANHVLVKYGLRPIAVEVVKQDYTESLNHYYVTRDMQPLLDLYLRLYTE